MRRILKNYHPNQGSHNWIMYKIQHDCIIQNSKFLKGTIADLGCGTMPYRDILTQYCENYIGVDWAESQHEFHADICADLNSELPMKSNQYDSVISFSVLEHLYNPQSFLTEAFRVLKPGGNLVMQVPFMWWVHEAPHDYFRFTSYGLHYLLEKAGFKHITIKAQTGFFLTIVLKLNYQSARIIKGPKILQKLLKMVVSPIWVANQVLAYHIDKIWPGESETAGYFVTAQRPEI